MNIKQRVFVEEYLRCWNATEAAKRAGYSERTARQQGSRLLSNANILEEIDKRISEKAMAADEVLIRLAEQARVSLDEVIDVYGKGKHEWNVNIPKIIADGKGHLIKSLTPTQYGLKVELHDKQRALELLGKHHRLFVDRQEITGADGGAIVLVKWDEPTDTN